MGWEAWMTSSSAVSAVRGDAAVGCRPASLPSRLGRRTSGRSGAVVLEGLEALGDGTSTRSMSPCLQEQRPAAHISHIHTQTHTHIRLRIHAYSHPDIHI